MTIKKYLRVWRRHLICTTSAYISNRVDSVTYFMGKVVRLAFFLIFVISIFQFSDTLAGYTKNEVLLFFLTFNLMDVLPQAMFRGLYVLTTDVRKGNFDYTLTKPMSALFLAMTKITDILDIVFLGGMVALLLGYVLTQMAALITIYSVAMYTLFVLIGLLIIIGINIISAAISILTVENEGFIMVYRVAMTAGRFPPEVFPSSVRALFTFVVPVIVVVAFPVKAFLGKLTLGWGIAAFGIAVVFLGISVVAWKYSIQRYSSASS